MNSELRTIAACQILTGPDIDTNLHAVLERLDEAAARRIDLVAFPEGTLFGYECSPEYWSVDRSEVFAEAERAIRERCRRLGIAAVVGTAVQRDGEWLNAVIAIDRDGRVRACYGKTYLAGEPWCRPFTGALPVVRLAGIECCFIICHDIRYPELVRLPAMAGARLCIFCSNESGLLLEEKLSAYYAMPVARATENDIFLLMANAPADREHIAAPTQSHGNSKIVHPNGNVLVEAGFFTQGLVTATVDFSEAGRRHPLNALRADSGLGHWWRVGQELVEAERDGTEQE